MVSWLEGLGLCPQLDLVGHSEARDPGPTRRRLETLAGDSVLWRVRTAAADLLSDRGPAGLVVPAKNHTRFTARHDSRF